MHTRVSDRLSEDIRRAAEELRVEANEVMASAFDEVDFIIAATNPGPAFAADSAMSSPSGGFIEWAKSSTAANFGFRTGMGTVRMLSGAFPKLPNRVLDEVLERFPDLVAMGALTIISNVYGNPAMSVPMHWNDDGLPIGVHILGRFGDEATLFRLAAELEQARPWADRRPPIFGGV